MNQGVGWGDVVVIGVITDLAVNWSGSFGLVSSPEPKLAFLIKICPLHVVVLTHA